jgi:hypothetical protein
MSIRFKQERLSRTNAVALIYPFEDTSRHEVRVTKRQNRRDYAWEASEIGWPSMNGMAAKEAACVAAAIREAARIATLWDRYPETIPEWVEDINRASAVVIPLTHFPHLNTLTHVALLNTLAQGGELYPEQIAEAAGCDMGQAVEILMLMYHKGVTEMYTLLYCGHCKARAGEMLLREGFPDKAVACPTCQAVLGREDLLYGMMARLLGEVEFVVGARPEMQTIFDRVLDEDADVWAELAKL